MQRTCFVVRCWSLSLPLTHTWRMMAEISPWISLSGLSSCGLHAMCQDECMTCMPKPGCKQWHA